LNLFQKTSFDSNNDSSNALEDDDDLERAPATFSGVTPNKNQQIFELNKTFLDLIETLVTNNQGRLSPAGIYKEAQYLMMNMNANENANNNSRGNKNNI
jgi:hypothetical protein